MKKCSSCKEYKDKSKFCKNARYVDSLHYSCRLCVAVRNKRVKQENSGWVKKYKENSPCADCNVKYAYYVMDFDHIDPAKKKFMIGRAVSTGGKSLKIIRKEIEKCDLVCANCHRIRTHKFRK